MSLGAGWGHAFQSVWLGAGTRSGRPRERLGRRVEPSACQQEKPCSSGASTDNRRLKGSASMSCGWSGRRRHSASLPAAWTRSSSRSRSPQPGRSSSSPRRTA